MRGTDAPGGREDLNRVRFVAALMEVGAILIVVVTLIWALPEFWTLSQRPQPTVADFFQILFMMVAGIVAGPLLWGAAEILRKLDGLQQVFSGASSALHISDAEGIELPLGSGNQGDNAASQEMLALLREIRDLSLLNDHERTMRMENMGQAEAKRLSAEVPALLREHNWMEARRKVEAARSRFPAMPQWIDLEQQIEKQRAQVEARDLDAASRTVADLIALSAWERVNDLVAELLSRHPESARAQELARRVQREREKSADESCSRLMARAQEATRQRDWTAAIEAARTVIQHYPGSLEATALRQQIATLEENAEIQHRQQREADYRELLQNHRYEDAVRLARELIERYPHSPQAAVMREQLPRLEAKLGYPQ